MLGIMKLYRKPSPIQQIHAHSTFTSHRRPHYPFRIIPRSASHQRQGALRTAHAADALLCHFALSVKHNYAALKFDCVGGGDHRLEAQGSLPPRISERAGRVVAQAGSRVTLPCVAQGHPPPHYTWYRGSTPLTPSSGVWTVGGSLVLGGVGVGDAGEYTCVANNSAGETRFSAHLLVTTPLTVQVTPREVQVDAGGRLELRCHVSGEPVDTVTWFKDGVTLRFFDVRRPHEDPAPGVLARGPRRPVRRWVYQCAATYGTDYAHAYAHVTLGAETGSIEITDITSITTNVLDPPSVSVFTTNTTANATTASTSTTTITSSSIITSRARQPTSPSAHSLHQPTNPPASPAHQSTSPPTPAPTHQPTNPPVHRPPAHSTSPPTPPGPGPPANEERRKETAAPQLVYRFIEQTLQHGPAVSLKCIATGTPTPHITWALDGFPIPHSHRYLKGQYVSAHGDVISHVNISSVHVTDGGTYSCTAENSAGKVVHSARLNVYGPPHIRPMGQLSAVAGETFSVTCPASGYPLHKIIWTKDGVRLPTGHRQRVFPNGTLVIEQVTRGTDDGQYSCTAMSRQGRSDTQQLTVRVMVAPEILPFHFEKKLQQGTRAGVACIVSTGDPPITFTWQKDGRDIKGSEDISTSKMGDYSNALLINNLTAQHSGVYTCTAANSWAKATHSASLDVTVPPRLAPMVFPAGTRAGMRAQATCLVQEGDQPVSLSWTKDGQPIDPQLDVRFSQLDVFTSIIVIERATAAHSGNYTCAATNPARTATTTGPLTVSVPPAWVVEPSSANVALGGTVALHCLAKGFPNPTVVWRKETALQTEIENIRESDSRSSLNLNRSQRLMRLKRCSVSGEFAGVATGEGGVAGFENGTLLVSRAERRHEGRYLCEANNEVGAGLSKVVTLSVNEPPWFAVRSQRQQVVVGATATLSCEAHGDIPLKLVWTRDGAPLPALPRCNGKVHVVKSVTAIISKYRRVGVEEEGSRHLTLTWTPPEDSNAPISAYIVTFTSHDSQPSQEGLFGAPREVTVEGDQRRVRIEGLLPATMYVFTVVAENRVGRSQQSSPLRVKTQEEAPSGHPQNVRVVPVSSTALQVSWEPPHENLTHGTVLGYYLGYKDDSESEGGAYNFTTVGVDSVGVTTATLAGLRPHARYSVVLQAFNSRGAGPASPPALGTTLEDKPGAPPGHVTCETVTSSSVVVTWSPPPPRQANGIITNYRVTYTQMFSHEEGRTGSVVSEGLRATLTGLKPWTNYSVSVAASTRAGEGVQSLALVCTTEQDVPEAPARVKAVVSGPRAAVVSWAPPLRPRGRITRYTVHWASAGSRSMPHTRRVGPHVTHLTLHDLPHTTHEVWVTASTRMGEGPKSSVTVVTPSHTVGAGIWAVGGNLTAAWKEDVSLPCGAVGVPEPVLTWSHETLHIPESHSSRFTVQPDGTLTLTDIQRSDSGQYTCTASNHHGVDSVTYNLTVLVPPSAPSLHVTETTASSIRVQWSVEDTGGASLQGATLHYR
nr:Down syndrome cell adhesion molecule-like protein Dscam2 [Penaeus vannamei]